MSNIYLTSDLHFNHNKDFILEPRGFNDVNDMNNTIIKNWNETINDNDIVYILGDLMLGCTVDEGLALLSQLKGIKYLAFGNHDTSARIEAYEKSGLFERIEIGYRMRYKKYNFILSHYPTITANGDDLRVINLFGHTHQKEKFYEDRPYMYNVGLDAHDMKPVSIDEIIKDIKQMKRKLEGI